jgi:hypothetical protein
MFSSRARPTAGKKECSGHAEELAKNKSGLIHQTLEFSSFYRMADESSVHCSLRI